MYHVNYVFFSNMYQASQDELELQRQEGHHLQLAIAESLSDFNVSWRGYAGDCFVLLNGWCWEGYDLTCKYSKHLCHAWSSMVYTEEKTHEDHVLLLRFLLHCCWHVSCTVLYSQSKLRSFIHSLRKFQ